MSSIHSLQQSTSREKLLDAVRALRPFLCASLGKSGFEQLQYMNGDDELADTYLQAPHCVSEHVQDSLIHTQNILPISAYAQGELHQMHNKQIDGHEDNAHDLYHGLPAYANGDQAHDPGHTDRQHGISGHSHINIGPGCNITGTVHAEGDGHEYGYLHDGNYIDISQVYGHIRYGQYDGLRSFSVPSSSASMPELRIDKPNNMLSTAEENMLPCGTHTLRVGSHDEWMFTTEETNLQLLPPHSPYSHTQHTGYAADYHLHSQCDFHGYNPQCQGIINEMAPSIDNIGLNTEPEGWLSCCNDNAINKIPTAFTPLFLSPSVEAKVPTTTCTKAASVSQSQWRKRRQPTSKGLPDLDTNPNADSSDESDAMEDEGGKNGSNPNAKASSLSSSLASSVVPIVSKLSVSNIEKNTYHLRICCEKGPGDLLQLARAVESLDFEILCTNIASIGDQSTISSTVVDKSTDTNEALKPEKVEEMLLGVIGKYGFQHG